jgi:hypothetical protein
VVTVPTGVIRDRLDKATTPARTGPTDRYEMLMGRGTHGDLASDTGYRDAVLTLWDRQVKHFSRGIGRDLRGDPEVIWAGNTPVGPAAVVVQRAYLKEHEDLNPVGLDRNSTVIGFIGVDGAGQPHVVHYDYWQPDHLNTPGDAAWYVDPAQSVLVVRDIGAPVGWGSTWQYRADGHRVLELQKLTFQDGAAIVRFPADVDRTKVRLSRMPYGGSAASALWITHAPEPADHYLTDRQLNWPDLHLAGTGRSRADNPKQVFDSALSSRTDGVSLSAGNPNWLATGQLANGSEILVGDVALDNDPSHSYAVVIAPNRSETVAHGGAVDPQATLPIIIRLPDNAGWAVARARAALSWRTGSGPWHNAGTSAALVPTAATDIGVTQPGGTRVTVPLR